MINKSEHQTSQKAKSSQYQDYYKKSVKDLDLTHVLRWKSSPCAHFSKGKCMFGRKCRFAHDESTQWIKQRRNDMIQAAVSA